MNTIIISKKDEIVMRLVHYFITEENYTPIIVNGVKDEVWLENSDAKYKIVRINSNFIYNNEQFITDIYKIKNVVQQIRKKTLSLTMNTFNIFLDVNDDVKLVDDKNIKSIFIKDVNDLETDKITKFFPGIENKLMKDTEGFELILNITEGINAKTDKTNEIYEATFRPKKLIITPIIIGICVLLFMLMYMTGNINNIYYAFGVLDGAIKNGEVWRLITGAFLHGGIIHLFVNMYSLFVIGSQMESFIGKTKYLTVYLGSAITASLMSAICNNSGIISIGASGAIFGLLGSMLYFGYHFRLYLGSTMKSQIIPLVMVNLMLGFYLEGIDNAAHIGGLIGGYFITMALGITGKSQTKDKINGLIVTLIYILFLSYILFFR